MLSGGSFFIVFVVFIGGFSFSVYMMYIYIGAGAAGLILLIATVILSVKYR